MSEAQHALIAGGGIGGLCAAASLRNRGFEVSLFERRPEIHGLGAGISLMPNATRALTRLGLGHIVDGHDVGSMRGGLFDRRGEMLSAGTTAEIEARYGSRAIVLHRESLIAQLKGSLEGVEIRCDAPVNSYEARDDGVQIGLESGESVRGALLVIADGARSRLRAQLGHRGGPEYAGYTAWRGVAKLADAGLVAEGDFWGVYLGGGKGNGAECGLVPLADGRVYWYATQNTSEGGQGSASGHKADVLEHLRDWPAHLRRVVDATPAEGVLRNDILHMDPLTSWGEGRVTLLGDSAHPMTPNMGQGGCMAIEDAWVLGECLAANPDIPAALRSYEGRRIPRVTRVVKGSRTFGRAGQLENPLLCWLRNQFLRRAGIQRQVEQLEWLLGDHA